MLPYRTILRLPSKGDVIHLAEQEVQTWLAERVDRDHRRELEDGAYFAPGQHSVGSGKEMHVARQDRPDGSRGLLLRLVETTSNGTYMVTVTAIDNMEHQWRQDSLLIEAVRLDQGPIGFQVDPPRFVRQLLAREDVYDGVTPVTAAPRLANLADGDEVFDSITDPLRSVSVIVAASLGRAHDEELRIRVTALTQKTVGVAAVFVADEPLVGALNERLPASHALERGRVRTYLPAVDLLDRADGRRHRVLGPETFARAIRGNSVSRQLQAAFAEETRGPLVARPLPKDLRRAYGDLLSDLASLDRTAKVSQRARAVLSTAELASAPIPEPLEIVESALPTDSNNLEPRALVERIRNMVVRWLKRDSPVTPSTLDELDTHIATSEATAEALLEDAARLESELQTAREATDEARDSNDDLELELAEAQDENSTLRRRAEYLQARLSELGDYAAAYAEPHEEELWRPPAGLLELATILTADAAQPHIAFERVQFTGDLSFVEELQKRDSIGRYSNAFWEYVKVLYDYVDARKDGFQGGVHQYLADERVPGRKCSLQRHASTESETVLKNTAWSAERMLPVPSAVDASGSKRMDAHFKPTHRDTVAPRMHYYDDTAGPTGKIYIGYIGKHLTNTKTKNA